MERSRLKTVIIIILLLLNAFLLISILGRSHIEKANRSQVEEQLTELFQADNIRLDPSAISSETAPSGQIFVRSPDQERTMIASFLGNSLTVSDQGGGIFTYGSAAGAARFSSSGSFDIIGTQIIEDAEVFCRSFCRDYNFKELVFDLDETKSGTASAVRYYDGFPIFNCSITFTIAEDAIRKVSGTFLPETAAPYADQQTLSSTAALDAFLSARRESGAVVSEISEMYLCYEVKGTAASPTALTPSWCIITDTSCYYVNCYTGEVTHP